LAPNRPQGIVPAASSFFNMSWIMFDRTGFFAVPLDQPLHLPIEYVGSHGKVFDATASANNSACFVRKRSAM
jgi:hypothetical protein